MNLVVVESPSKAKTINKYLGKDYVVKASKGHVVDLPKSKLGIDVENKFKPDYQVTNEKSLSELKQAFKQADKLILAVDLDREGEAIAWHIAKELNVIDEKGNSKGKKPVERIVFSEITKPAIKEALEKPRSIDMNLVNAQQARRVLDRLVGYKLSPLLWKKIQFGLSAGRVQSVALRLIVEREEERNSFKPDEYWSVNAYENGKKSKDVEVRYKLKSDEAEESDIDEDSMSDSDSVNTKVQSELEGVRFELSKISGKKPELSTQNIVKEIVEKIKSETWIVKDVTASSSKRNAKAPFITSTLQQAGVNVFGFSAKRTMQVAQKLYESGYITYMRTDSTNMSNEAKIKGEEYIKKKYGESYLPKVSNAYKTSNKAAQEAHECIRPVDFFSTSNDLGLEGEQKKIYDLIWKRALSSLMAPAEVLNQSVVVTIDEVEFKANGVRVTFDGFLKVYPEKINETVLPEYKTGQEVYPYVILADQHFTQPPARYSEATLIKKLEDLEIGRPSTYASIISTIIARKYVETVSRYLVPTDVGIVVNKLLVKYFDQIVDYGFTAQMEEKLDNIAEGKMDWVKMLGEFYFPFEKEVLAKDKKIDRKEFTQLGTSDEKCPECGSAMVIKLGRYGKFLSCTKYPKCTGMKSLTGLDEDKNGVPDTLDLANYEPAPKSEDGREYILKRSRFGSFWAHPDYPKVKDAKPLLMTRAAMLEKFKEIPQTEDGRDFVLRNGKFGQFWAHPDYPSVKEIRRIGKNGTVKSVSVGASARQKRISKDVVTSHGLSKKKTKSKAKT